MTKHRPHFCVRALILTSLVQLVYSGPSQDDPGSRLGDNSLLWTYAMEGAGVASPLLYNVTQSGDDAIPLVFAGSNDRHVYALHATNGSLVWKRDVGSRVQISPIHIRIKTTATDKPLNFIIVSGERGNLLAMDPSDGGIAWIRHLARPMCKPAISERFAYVGSGANVVVVHLVNGTIASEFTVDGEDVKAITITPHEENPNNHEEYSGATLAGFPSRRLFVTTAKGNLTSFQVTEVLGQPVAHEVTFSYDSGGNLDYQSAPTWAPGHVFLGGFSNILHALDDVTGEVLWTFEAKDVVSQAAVSRDGLRVIMGSSDQFLYSLSIGTGDLLWSKKVGHSIQSMPSIGDDDTIVVTGTAPAKLKKRQGATNLPRVVAFDAEGEERWTVSVDGLVFSSAVRSKEVGGTLGCSLYFTDTSRLVYRVGACVDMEPRDEL